MFLDGRELVELELWNGKTKTECTVTNINTLVTASKEDHHQSVRAIATELKIGQELPSCCSSSICLPHAKTNGWSGWAQLVLQKQLYLGFYLRYYIPRVLARQVMNHKIYCFFLFNALQTCTVCRLSNSLAPFVFLKILFWKITSMWVSQYYNVPLYVIIVLSQFSQSYISKFSPHFEEILINFFKYSFKTSAPIIENIIFFFQIINYRT